MSRDRSCSPESPRCACTILPLPRAAACPSWRSSHLRRRSRPARPHIVYGGKRRPRVAILRIGWLLLEEVVQVLFHVEAGGDRVEGGVSVDLGGVEVQLLAQNHPRLGAHL